MCISRVSPSTAVQNEHTHFMLLGEKMNEVFLIGNIIEKVEYKFMLEKRQKCQSKNKTRINRQNKTRNYSI